jgi:signal peptidase I
MTATVPDETASDREKKKRQPGDRVRESIETVVFVVVLVLLLKLFVTEAFVIPTGSMAETLYGYQKIITCPKCGHVFPVNSHDEVEGVAEDNNPGGVRRPVEMVGFTCPNCRFPGRMDQLGSKPDNRTGDRVLVLKPIYHVQEPTRGDVVVFKYPQAPQERQIAQNYIKRAMAFGGETAAIFHGDIYVTRSLDYPADATGPDGLPLYERPEDPLELWRPRYMYPNNAKARELFDKSRAASFPAGQGGFEIFRKSVDHLLADRRIVWDNDKQPVELAGKAQPRWYAAPGSEKQWKGNNVDLPTFFTHTAGSLEFIRYRHLIYPWDAPETAKDVKPAPVDNVLGYNSEVSRYRDSHRPTPPRSTEAEHEWVGDLILDCEVDVKDGSEVVLELSRGTNRFQATFANGTVKLSSTGPGAKEFGSRDCKVKGAGTFKLRFANVDARLHVWVNDRHIDFGTDADYLPGSTIPSGNPAGWTQENDVDAPASIGAKGEVTVRSIQLHRDVFYTQGMGDTFIYYIHPGHYLCLGDNSAQSSDSRTWGTVPERLMLGKAVFVFWPSWLTPPNRIGLIK